MFKTIFSIKLPKSVSIVLVLVIAAFLRLYRISDYMTFLGDEGRDVLVVYNILHGRLTLLGPTASVGGFFLGPIYYYFMAPFLWIFNYNPSGPAVMVALFGIATVYLVYKIGSEFFNKKTGLIAAFLYSISPLVIAYSRSSWNPNLMPFFSILTLYFLFNALKRKSWKLFILTGSLFGVLMQLHYLSTFLGLVILLYVAVMEIFTSKKFSFGLLKGLKEYFFIFVGFLVGWSPFLAFETRHGFPNINSTVNFIFHSSETGANPRFIEIIGDISFRLFGRLITMYPPPEQVSSSSTISIDIYLAVFKFPTSYLYYFTFILMFISLIIFSIKYVKSIKEREEKFLKLSLLFIWFTIGIIMFGFYQKPIYDYYLGFLFPLPFLLIGNLLSSFYSFSSIKPTGKIIAISIFLILAALNLSGIPFRHPANRQAAQVEEISRFVFDKTGGKPFNFALITGGNSDHAYRYFFKLWGRDPVIIENVINDPNRNTVTDQLLIVCEKSCSPLGDPLWEVAGFGRGEIQGEWDVSVVKVYKLIHYRGN